MLQLENLKLAKIKNLHNWAVSIETIMLRPTFLHDSMLMRWQETPALFNYFCRIFEYFRAGEQKRTPTAT